MKKSVPIVFFGSDNFSVQILKGLITDHRFDVVAVVTKPRRLSGRNRQQSDQPVMDLAESSNIEVLVVDSWGESTIGRLKSYGAQIGVLASFGSILPPAVLKAFELGIINVHPSLLPRWRGASPIESSILHGDESTGVSIIQLIEKMDAGPIFAQQPFDLNHHETQDSLYKTLANVGSELLLKTLPSVVDKTIKSTPQVEEKATFAPLLKKTDGTIDWNQNAQQIERQIRAFNNWPQSRARLCNRDVIVLAASLYTNKIPKLASGETMIDSSRQLVVATGNNQALRIDKIKPAGKGEMDGQSFVRGYCADSSSVLTD